MGLGRCVERVGGRDGFVPDGRPVAGADVERRRRCGRAHAVLEAVGVAVDEIAGVDVRDLPGETLVEWARALAVAVSRLGAVRGRVLAGLEKSGAWEGAGERTFSRFNERVSGVSGPASVREIGRAREVAAELPVMERALVEGAVFAEHVDVVRKVFSSPALKGELARPGVQEELVEMASDMVPREFERRVKAWAYREDPSVGVETEKAEARAETLTLVKTGAGMRISGWLSDETSALVDTALSGLMGRKRADDPRTAGQRRAQALIELAGTRLDGGGLAAGARVRPHLSVHVPLATLAALEKAARAGREAEVSTAESVSGSARGRRGSSERPSDAGRGEGSRGPECREGSCSALAGKTRRSGNEACRERGGQGRVGDCLADVAIVRERLGKRVALISSGFDVELMKGASPATLDDGSPLSVTQTARILCDSAISRVVFSPRGEVLDVGREKRIFTTAQARAVIARDRTCRYPGCGETIAHGQIHHSLPWEDGGGTDIDNAMLLCWHHHALIHREMIGVAHHDGGFVFTGRDGSLLGVRKHGT